MSRALFVPQGLGLPPRRRGRGEKTRANSWSAQGENPDTDDLRHRAPRHPHHYNPTTQHNHLKNQPHFNAALRDANLRVTLLPCNLFPNGYRYASEKWRAAQQWLNGEPWRPVSVHNNWIKGHEAKLARFREWAMWDENVTR